jgi:hypothetical protein
MSNTSNTPDNAFDELTPKQQKDVGSFVARMMRSGQLSMTECKAMSNRIAQAILESPKVGLSEIFEKIQADVSAQAALDTDPMSWFSFIADQAISAKLAPEPEQLEHAQSMLKQMTPRNQRKIKDAIDARVKNEKGPNGRNLGPVSCAIAKENLLVALMQDDAAIDQVLTTPSRPLAGHWPR